MRKIIIGSRGSELALWQAEFVKEELRKLKVETEIKIIKTQGDEIQHLSFDKMEGKGFFTKEIESALLAKDIDLAVHSHKDLETSSPEGLRIAAVSYREDPRDVLLVRPEALNKSRFLNIKENAVVGTSSARRKSQLLNFDPSITIKDLRGNVPTRIGKLLDGNYDAIVIAAAGLERIQADTGNLMRFPLSPQVFIPAPAQGVLGLQIREDDAFLTEKLQHLNDSEVEEVIGVERAILKSLNGGCQIPFGAYCEKTGAQYQLWTSIGEVADSSPTGGNEKLKRFYIAGKDAKDIQEQAIKAVKESVNDKKILITRDEEENNYIFRYLKSIGANVTGKSFIRIKPMRFSSNLMTDWVFFSSKNAVKHFFDQQPQFKKKVRFGVIGSGTEQALIETGHSPSFVGKGVDTQQDGKAFQEELSNGDTVLFPQSKNSIRTIQKQLEFTAKVIDLYVYDTEIIEESDTIEADVVVFTSPSNVEGYFKSHRPDNEKTYIAIGKTTGKALELHQIKDYVVAWETSPLALCDAITKEVLC